MLLRLTGPPPTGLVQRFFKASATRDPWSKHGINPLFAGSKGERTNLEEKERTQAVSQFGVAHAQFFHFAFDPLVRMSPLVYGGVTD